MFRLHCDDLNTLKGRGGGGERGVQIGPWGLWARVFKNTFLLSLKRGLIGFFF